MKRVLWTQTATDDLREIEQYHQKFAADLASEIIATVILSTGPLLDFPGLGAPVGYRRWRRWRAGETRYLLIYQPVRDGIEVVRARHERSDWRPTSP